MEKGIEYEKRYTTRSFTVFSDHGSAGLVNKNKHDFGTSELFPSDIYLISLSNSTQFRLFNYDCSISKYMLHGSAFPIELPLQIGKHLNQHALSMFGTSSFFPYEFYLIYLSSSTSCLSHMKYNLIRT